MRGRYGLACLVLLALAATVYAQTAREHLATGHRLWNRRLAQSAVAAFEAATRDRATAAEAWEALGRIYLFRGWQQEGVFPGWHDEPEYREKALAALRTSLAADPSRASAVEALKQAEAFAASPSVVPPAPPRPEVKELDAKIEAFGTAKDAPLSEFDALITARTHLQADPAPYFTGAQIMLERRDFARAADLAERGATAAERFIAENEGALKMSGKAAGARVRSRVQALDILGTVAMRRLDFDLAAKHLEEAERLSRGLDFMVQFHLGDLAGLRKNVAEAERRYLDALSLAGGPAPLRERAMQALADLHAAQERSEGFEAWLDEAITRRREERRTAVLRSLVDRRLPDLALTGLDGRPVDVSALRGKVLLLNFFSSW
jgi:tetratricopeptide (TPR) repeat protein